MTGDAQTSQVVVKKTVASGPGVTTTLYLNNGATNEITFPPTHDGAMVLRGQIVGFDSFNGNAVYYEFQALVKVVSGIISLVGVVNVTTIAEDVAGSFNIIVAVAANTVSVRVKNNTAFDHKVSCFVRYTQTII